MKNILFIIGFLMSPIVFYGQNISGPTNVTGGHEYTYTFTCETAGLAGGTTCSVLVTNGTLISVVNGAIILGAGQKSVTFKVRWYNTTDTGKIRIFPTHGGAFGILDRIAITANNSSETPGDTGNPVYSDLITISGQKITSDRSYHKSKVEIVNTSISNNAKVSIEYHDYVSIKPPFNIILGSTVSISECTEYRLLPAEVYYPRSAFGTISESDAVSTLEQNAPNPFDAVSKISYSIPETTGNAYLQIFNLSGKMINKVEIRKKGSGFVMLEKGNFQPGTIYLYSLIVDGKVVDTKKFYVK